ncbi:MAG: ribokinase, partial [Ruthenibacterium sp.]
PMNSPKILVVGSFVMDQIASTEVFPNEGETVLGLEFCKAPGGKGANQAVQASLLGADVTMFGKLGRDANGAEMLNTCKNAGICMDSVVYDDTSPSGCSMIILQSAPGEQAKNRIIVISGANMSIVPSEVEYLKERICEYDLVMLQLEIPIEINELVAAYAYEKHVPVMLNSAPSAPLSDELLSHLTYISPNEHEAQDLSGISLERRDGQVDMDKIRQAAQTLQRRGVKNVLITLGESGAAYLDERGNFIHSPSAKGIVAVDPTAAGDSFVGAFCVGICSAWSTEEALRFANHTAALTVTKNGAMPSLPTLKEIESFMLEHSTPLPDARSSERN